MQVKLFALVSLAGLAVAQQAETLVQALNGSSQLSNLTALLSSQPQLVATLANLTNITILAPNNNAISALLNTSVGMQAASNQALLQAVLSYHVLNGSYATLPGNTTFVRTALQSGQYANVTGGQRVEVMNTTATSGLKQVSNITSAPINFTGGYIHIIDRVLTLPESVAQTATAFNLTAFTGALSQAMLINTVNGVANSTFFVPNNAAFQAIGSGLSGLTTQQLASILAYHVVNGTVAYSTGLSNETVPTFGGGNLNVSVHGGNVFVNSAKVVIPDILVANGVVHVIDQVLNPNNTMAANSTATAGMPAFSGASSASDVPYTSGQPTPTSSINTASIQSSASARASSSSSSGAAWMPGPTGAVGAALGGLALLMQL